MKFAAEAHFENINKMSTMMQSYVFLVFFLFPLLLLVHWSLKRMTIKGEKVELPEVVSSCGSDCLKMGRSLS